MQLGNLIRPLDRRLVFVTGAPRSGTSLLTKVLDAHPDLSVLMENIFDNRRRHARRSRVWTYDWLLKRKVAPTFRRLTTPIVGNKVCTPDVWNASDILQFCGLFSDADIVFIVRDPEAMCISRHERTDFEAQFTGDAKSSLPMDFSSPYHAYATSWVASIRVLQRLQEADYPVHVVYYGNLTDDFETVVPELLERLGLSHHPDVDRWHELPHHDKDGRLVADLKYRDRPIEAISRSMGDLDDDQQALLRDALTRIPEEFMLAWKDRRL